MPQLACVRLFFDGRYDDSRHRRRDVCGVRECSDSHALLRVQRVTFLRHCVGGSLALFCSSLDVQSQLNEQAGWHPCPLRPCKPMQPAR
jgi:hypothetical protein